MTDLGIGSWPSRRARMRPDRVALRQEDRARTYGELAERVDALAGGLAARGIRAGDRVAYLGPNDIATFEALFAAARIGAILVPLNTRLAPPEITYLLQDSTPSLLFYGGPAADLVSAVDGTPPLVAVDPATRVRDAEVFEDVAASSGPLPDTEVTLDQDAVILYTSGTTGRPKGAALTHANLTFNTFNQLVHLDVLSTDVVLCTAPLFHAVGLAQASLPALIKGGTVVVAPKFDVSWVLRIIRELGITAFASVPTMLQMMVDHPDWPTADLSTVRYVNYGGSPVLDRVARAWMARGVRVVQGYGQTESSPGVTMELPDRPEDTPISAGVPHFFTDLALLDWGGDVSHDQGTGELLVRGPNVFRGYWQRPAETEATLHDGWLRTGDVAQRTDDGHVHIVGRINDLIISGGENIYPSEVETAIAAFPEVQDVVLVGVPDEQWGEVGAAYVTLHPDAVLAADELRERLAGELAKFKIPKHVRFVDELPRNATGKVRRDQLRADFTQKEQAQ